MEATSTTPKARYATQAAGTWTYMMRCTLPWVTSRGATPKPMTRPTASPARVSEPSVRINIASPFQDDVEGQQAGHHVDDVGGHQQGDPVRHGSQRLAGQGGLGGPDRGQQHG